MRRISFYQKVHLLTALFLLLLLHEFELTPSSIECALTHAAFLCSFFSGDFLLFHVLTISEEIGGGSLIGLPIWTPRAFAAAIPSACRCRMLLRSFSATKDSTWRTMSLRNVPTKFLPRRVSSKGISMMHISIPF